jgi:hypothetical protein
LAGVRRAATRITWRGDSHYGRAEATKWCEENAASYIFGVAGNAVLDSLCRQVADDLCMRRAEEGAEKNARLHLLSLSGQELEQAAQSRGTHRGGNIGVRYLLHRHLAARRSAISL